MQFNVLGSLEVLDAEGRPVDVGGAQPRAVLVMLLLAADRVVPADTIIDRLWPDNPPASANGTLQSYMSRLRRAIDPKSNGGGERALAWEARGYRLHPDPNDAVDFHRFEELVERGRDLLGDDPREARDVLAEALELWRGPALVEFADHGWARGPATRLDERRLAAMEARLRADLQLGRHELVIGELTDLIEQHPLHEGFRELFAIALYRSGRQAEALRAIDDLRRQLVDGLGVDPSHRIRELESQILDHHPALAAPVVAAGESVGADATSPPTADAASHELEGAGGHVEGLVGTELVGRDAEKQSVWEVLDAGLKGVTQWVVFEGEPGIGKTRLLEHMAGEAIERGYNVMWGRCYESGAPPAFWLWLAPLRGLVDPRDPLPPQTQELVDRLLAPQGDDSLVAPVDASRFRLFEAVGVLLRHAARRQPVMLALDDVQWADPASLELIEYLTGAVPGSALAIACTVRQLEIGRNDAVVHALAHISRRPVARRLQLAGLDKDAAAELARQSTDTNLSPDVVDAIHRRSEGNPFFIGELARLLASEQGLTSAELVRRAAVPAGVRDVVHRRLVQLPTATVELVQVAATIGRETTLGLLSRAAGITIDRCIDDLDPAFVNRLVVEAADCLGTVRFSHALVREVVLDDMSMLRRSRLHLRAADAIEAMSRHSDDDAEIIADHLWQAAALGVEERAAIAMERAADVALRRFAYETAEALLERAIQLRGDFAPERADPNAELDALTRLIQIHRVWQGFERARVDSPIERAKALARETKRDREFAMLLWTEWAGACTSCDFDLAGRFERDLQELAEVNPDDTLLRATADHARGVLCWHLGQIDEAVAHLDAAMVYLDATADSGVLELPGGAVESEVLSRCFHVFVHELAGKPLPGGSPLPDLAARNTDPYTQLMVLVFESLRALVGGDVDEARDAVAKARAIEIGSTFQLFGGGAISIDGCLKALTGDPIGGTALIERGAEMYTSAGVLTFVPFYMSIGAVGFVRAGDLERAQQFLARSKATLERTGELWQLPYVLGIEARVLAATPGSDPDEVAALVREAYAVAITQGAHGSAARVAEAAEDMGIALD